MLDKSPLSESHNKSQIKSKDTKSQQRNELLDHNFVTCPFTVAICTNEGLPYRFTGFQTDKSSPGGGCPLVIQTVTKPLYLTARKPIELDGYVYQKGLADYSIQGMEELIQVERKSLEDLFGTIGGRRNDFEAEIARLNQCERACVVIEATMMDVIHNPPEYSSLDPKTISRTVISWQLRYPNVHWQWCGSREFGEAYTFRYLEMFWRQKQHAQSAA